MTKRLTRLAVMTLAVALPAFEAASAQDVTLRAVSAFPTGSTFQLPFKKFIDEVNAAGDGSVTITYVGGASSSCETSQKPFTWAHDQT